MMPNSKLDKALANIENEKEREKERQDAEKLTESQNRAAFEKYRNDVVMPILMSMAESLRIKGHAAEIIKSEDYNINIRDPFVEFRFQRNSTQLSPGGPSIIVLYRGGVEVIAIDERPISLNLNEHQGYIIDPEREDIEEAIIAHITSRMR